MSRNKFLILLAVAVAAALPIAYFPNKSDKGYNPDNDEALQTAFEASARGEELRRLVAETPEAEQRDMAYLIVNMPEHDRDAMDVELLKENVTYANIARNKYAWAQALPEEVYLCDVLPYSVVDEVRDSWRKAMYELFSPAVDTCETMYDAICAVNANIPALTGVHYNTKREKTNQSPSESIRQGMASCTGLSLHLWLQRI